MWQSLVSFVHTAVVATGLVSAPAVGDAPPREDFAADSAVDVEQTTPTEAPVTIAAKGEKTAAELQAVVSSMQKTYESTNDFRADFTQRFTYTVLRRTQESQGTVQFKKPGLMRWDYSAPVPKQFVVDGSSLWIHTPSDKTAIVNKCFKQDGLTASV